jgi:hypothetical protein
VKRDDRATALGFLAALARGPDRAPTAEGRAARSDIEQVRRRTKQADLIAVPTRLVASELGSASGIERLAQARHCELRGLT